MSKFSSQHYNSLAKTIREEWYEIADMDIRTTGMAQEDLESMVAWRRKITFIYGKLCMALARKFKADNERFDPVKFLDACSPDLDAIPLGELWDEGKED